MRREWREEELKRGEDREREERGREREGDGRWSEGVRVKMRDRS